MAVRVKWNGELLTPRDVAKRVVCHAVEAAYYWQDRYRDDGNEDQRPTKSQCRAIDRQVARLVESIKARHGVVFNAGADRKGTK